MSTLANNCCQAQLLSVNNQSGYLTISQGNSVYLGTLIKTLGITTPVVDFALSGYNLTLTYTESNGTITYQTVDLQSLAQGGSITVSDTPTLDLTYSGANLSGNVNISAVGNNAIIANSDGIYSPVFSQSSLVANSSSTINFTTSGIATLSGAVKISANVGNQIQIENDGLFVGDNTTYILAGQNINITGIGAALSPYVISASNGSQTPLSVNNSSSISFQTSGTLGYTLTGNVNLSAASANALIIHSDGLYVPQSSTNSYTDAQARAAISATAPLLYNSTTGVMSLTQATSSVSGYLANSDWLNFNGKISTGQSLGSSSSVPVYAGQNGNTLNFNGLRAGSNVTITQSGNDLVIGASGSGGSNIVAGVIDFIVGDGGPLTPTANSSSFNPASNPLIGRTVLGVFVEGVKIAPVVRSQAVLYYTFTSSNGSLVLTNGVFTTDTYYSILYT
jgi:hypothetical protein